LMVTAYRNGRADRSIPEEDSTAELVQQVTRDGRLNEFVTYEFVSRVNPNATLLLSAQELDALTDFVERYLLVPKK
jgi:hypothetical protein